MRLLQKFKCHYHGSALAALWHRWAPPITIPRQFYGATVYMDLRDNIDDVTRSKSELENREQIVLAAPGAVDGLIWDVGANVGLFSVRAVTLGRPCIAFELSPKACRLLEKTKRQNNMSFMIVNRALTTRQIRYTSPASASAENMLAPDADGEIESITYLAAADEFGIPELIKMDIEGGEEDFFRSADFKQWLVSHSVAWLVEIHAHQLGYQPEWSDVPHCALTACHVLYAANDAQLQMLRRRFARNPPGAATLTPPSPSGRGGK